MKISVSMYSLVSTINEKGWTVMDFLHYAKNHSLDGVELLDIFWKDSENVDQEINEVKSVLQENNLVVSAYDISNDFVQESSKARKIELSKVIEGIRIAKQLDTNVVRVFTGNLKDGISYDNAQTWIIESLKRCAEVAEKEKIYLAIENHGLLAGKSEQIHDIIKSVDSAYVKSTFDTGNFLLLDESPIKALKRLKDEIAHIHFKDFREKHITEQEKGFTSISGIELIGCIPGDGKVDLVNIVDSLKENNYKGWLSIEFEGPEEAQDATLEAVNRLRELVN